MCGGYGDTNNDGKSDGIGAFLRDITDGGGPGRSGARFSSRDTGGLDLNQDNYISEQEYQRGQSNSESNADSGITGEIGDAYNNSRGVISNFSNSFGALPRGSIRQEAALGPQYGSPIETKNMARFMQGFAGDARDMAMAPVRAYRGEGALPDPVGTPEQQARSFDNIFNKGSSDFNKLPEAQQDAIIRGTRSLNSRLGRAVSVGSSIGPVSLPKTVVAAGTNIRTRDPDENFPNEALGNIRVNSITGNIEVLGPSGEVLSIIPASDYNMQNQ
jgi:hypothetical protein